MSQRQPKRDMYGLPLRDNDEREVDDSEYEDFEYANGEEEGAPHMAQQQPPSDFEDEGAFEQAGRQADEQATSGSGTGLSPTWVSRQQRRASCSFSDASDAASSAGKRKARPQLQQLPEWMRAFVQDLMTFMQDNSTTITVRKLKDLISTQLEQMPSEGQLQPSADDVLRTFTAECAGSPCCFEACRTIHDIVGHLASDPSSMPFDEGMGARPKAEHDLNELERAWRVVGNEMDEQFRVARPTFKNAVFNRSSGELPAPLQHLAAAVPQQAALRPNDRAVISLPTLMTPVCAGLENVGDDSAVPISVTFDFVRGSAGLDKHPVDNKPFWFKLEAGKDSEFNDGSAALLSAKAAAVRTTDAVAEHPDVRALLEHVDKELKSDDHATAQFELFVHWPAMRLKDTVDAAADMLDQQEAACPSGSDRGGKYNLDGSIRIRGRDYSFPGELKFRRKALPT